MLLLQRNNIFSGSCSSKEQTALLQLETPVLHHLSVIAVLDIPWDLEQSDFSLPSQACAID